MKFLNTSSKGFTLIELLVVIAIIGLLASTVLASVTAARSTARDAKRIAEGKSLASALELYRNMNGGLYPCAGNTPVAGNCDTAQTNVTGGIGQGVSRMGGSGTLDTVLLAALGFKPNDTSVTTGMQYRVEAGAIRSRYAIIVYLENRRPASPNDTYCRIVVDQATVLWGIGGTAPNTYPRLPC